MENNSAEITPPPAAVAEKIARWSETHRMTFDLAAGLGRLTAFTLEAAARMNLTSDREPELFWQRHIEDALASAEKIEEGLGGAPAKVLDVGSGSGMPGLVWAMLWPLARVDLLDSRQRRVAYLREAILKLRLTRSTAFEGRAETLARRPGLREKFDLVGARALGPLPTVLELTLPFARVGGYVAAIKSADVAEEIRLSREALRELGGDSKILTIPYERSDGRHCAICAVHKRRPTPEQYPRREGIPAQKPL